MPAPAASSTPAASIIAAGSSPAFTACCRSGTRPSPAPRSDSRRDTAGPPLAVGSMDLAAWIAVNRLADHAAARGRQLSGDAMYSAGRHRVRAGVVHDHLHPDGRHPPPAQPTPD